LKHGEREVATVEVQAVDQAGNRVPDTDQTIAVEVTGSGRLIALGNANMNDSTPFQSKERKLYQGKAVAVVRTGVQPGRITVRATAPGLTAAQITLTAEPEHAKLTLSRADRLRYRSPT
jgi:beta-galactosidase